MDQGSDAVVHFVHNSDSVLGNVSYATETMKILTGVKAFRSYNVVTETRGLNVAGDFRGMLISARWGTAYRVVSKASDWLGNVATLASLAGVTADMAPQFEQIYNSNAPRMVKAQKISLLTSIVAQKTLAGIVTGPVHLVYAGLIAGCNATAKASGDGKIASAAFYCSEVFKDADALVQNTADYVTNPNNQQQWIQSLYTINVAR